MSTIGQMKENCEILGDSFKPLTAEENEMLKQAARIRIPEILASLNLLNQFNNPRMARMKYYPAIGESSPRDCLGCGSCERACPQKLPIMQLIREADEKLYIGEGIDLWANH